MSEEEFNELKEKFNTLNDEIDQRIDLNIEIDKKNKIIFSLSILCVLGVFTSSFLVYKNLQYKKERDAYRSDYEYTSQELYKQDTKVNELEQALAKAKEAAAPKQKIKFNFSNMPALPETRHIYYDTKPQYIEVPVYIPQEQKSSLPQNDYDKEYREREFDRLQRDVENLKAKEQYDYLFPDSKYNPFRSY